ncbi:serine hydrolase [Actinosynnema pretiosum subsp. pretiosum]|uniref:Serine hydrolase n=1 Tax=Actinosynnema pretiosum subsp. pretiosum TaxID=103721 RepID=A0AA45R515_9PSEU|nr:putative beta-lactamase [Actinosynnema pretiosum subsp. pretiosum]QUF05193.1 serine hydrolase [Actinosynnema pretiosum subsp. pretiosum]
MIRRFLAVGTAIALLLALTTAPATAAPGSTQDSPDTQFAWLVDASARVPLPADEVAAHLDSPLLSAVGGVDGFNQTLASLGTLTAGAVVDRTPTELRQVVGSAVGELLGTLTVNPAGLIAGLRFSPHLPAPTSWEQVDAALGSLAPRVSFAAATITPEGCAPVHGLNERTARPLGSAFKLYVLGALAREVRAGRLSWDTGLPLRESWKSFPSGVLQDQPDGTVLTLAEHAEHMISISDNTATDHLIHLLGRGEVQRQFARFGNTTPNSPMPTTRELLTLKGFQYPAAATVYTALPQRLREAALNAVGRVPRTAVQPWTEPRAIDQLEWFGSPVDMCAAMAGLWQGHDPQLAKAMSINDGGIALPSARFPTIWFKGGSEPGVLTLSYLVRRDDGTLLTASAMLSDPENALDEATAAPQVLAVLRGALQLA